MSVIHPTPWTFSAENEFEDRPILDSNGDWVLVRDSGCYPPDLDTCREIVEAVNALYASSPPQGNDAAMREALEYAREVLAINGFVEPVVRCDAALSAPPRNCDVGTALEQCRRFWSATANEPERKRSVGEFSRWAQMPYEANEAKEGGAE